MTIPKLIAAHRLAWEAFQVAPEEAASDWEDALHEALYALCCTPVASHDDALLLAAHLDWYLSGAVEGASAEELPIAIHAALYWGQSRGIALLLATEPSMGRVQ